MWRIGASSSAAFSTGRSAAAAASLRAAFGTRYLSYRDLLSRGSAENVDRPRSGDDLACLIYTSGTTGNPKGVMLTHRNILANVEQSARAITIRPSDSFLAVLPLFHSFTLTVCVFIPTLLGGRIVLVRTILPFRNVVRAAVLRRPTIFIGVPQIFSLLSRRRLPRFLSWLLKIRLCVSGSAPLSPETLGNFERNFRIPLLEGYGLTEATPVVSDADGTTSAHSSTSSPARVAPARSTGPPISSSEVAAST